MNIPCEKQSNDEKEREIIELLAMELADVTAIADELTDEALGAAIKVKDAIRRLKEAMKVSSFENNWEIMISIERAEEIYKTSAKDLSEKANNLYELTDDLLQSITALKKE